VEDKARFLRAAFHPDKFQGHLQDLASERLKNINAALDALRAYWKTYGTVPGVSQPPQPQQQPKPQPPPQPPPKAEPAPKPEPNKRPEEPPQGPRQETLRQSTQQTAQQSTQGVFPVYEDANRLAFQGGYKLNAPFQAKLLDPNWWK
jgi:alkanesulfonate monooxygenase SsuD/methylene tetrahydromethanopterin reductase-like flavin-dependent oxidoreductase (luciferase family)